VNKPAVAEPGVSALRWLWLSVALIGLDQASKALIVARLDLFERREWLPLLEVTRLHNRGAAFSFLNDASGWQKYLFIGLALLVSAGIVVWLSRLMLARTRMLASGLSLILGGAIGNVIDRVARGYVVDFIHFHWYAKWDFPAFNVADTGITIGAALLILDSLLETRRNRTASAAVAAKEPGEP
jgi:signal peptidase II